MIHLTDILIGAAIVAIPVAWYAWRVFRYALQSRR
jgi:hypothetical protein